MQFPYGPLAPDQGDVANGTMLQADGVQPVPNGYGPFPGLSIGSTATALSGAPRGLFGYQTADGTWAIVGFTSSTVELKAADDTWTSIDTGLTCTSGDDWFALRFGTKLLYGNTSSEMRAYDVEAGGAAADVTAAKKPRWGFECGNILFLLDCLDNTSTRNNKLIRSSAFSDHTNFTTKGADYQPLESGGALIWGAKLADTTAIVLQQGGGKLIQVGNVGNALWGIQTIFDGFGAVGAKSCVANNGIAYWFSTDGFKRWGLGMGEPEPIGAGLVDRWFLDRVDQSDLSLIQASIDPFRKNVLWRWKRAANSSSVIFEDIIGYNWLFKRWFTLTLQTTYLGYSAQTAQTWDAYDATATWDSVDTSLIWDGRYLQGGQPIFGAMNSDYKFGYFIGSPMAGTLETAVSNSPVSSLIGRATPMDDSDDGTLELGVRDAMNDATTWKTGVAKQTSGRVPLRGRGKFIQFRRNITAASTWTQASGIDHIQTAAGGPR
jgi:hypothetical protein